MGLVKRNDKMSARVTKLLKQFKSELNRIYGKQLKAVYLYGSYARGENVEGSDLDIVVVLKDFQRRAAEIRRTSDLVGDLSLDYAITISPLFMREIEWETNKFSLLRNIKAEGVAF
jgi:type I restriction enzyme S subunit